MSRQDLPPPNNNGLHCMPHPYPEHAPPPLMYAAHLPPFQHSGPSSGSMNPGGPRQFVTGPDLSRTVPQYVDSLPPGQLPQNSKILGIPVSYHGDRCSSSPNMSSMIDSSHVSESVYSAAEVSRINEDLRRFLSADQSRGPLAHYSRGNQHHHGNSSQETKDSSSNVMQSNGVRGQSKIGIAVSEPGHIGVGVTESGVGQSVRASDVPSNQSTTRCHDIDGNEPMSTRESLDDRAGRYGNECEDDVGKATSASQDDNGNNEAGRHDDDEEEEDSYHSDEDDDSIDSAENSDDGLSDNEDDVEKEEMEKERRREKRKDRESLQDFIAPNDDEDTDDGTDYDSENDAVVEEMGMEVGVGGEGALSAEAMEHLTRLRARMSSREGGRDDMNRYFEALISYDDGIPTDKQPNSDEEWTMSDGHGKKRCNNPKKNRKGSPKKAHKCPVCARIFYQAKQLEKHQETHVKVKTFVPPSKLPPDVKFPIPRNLTCETCGKDFKRTAHLNRHRMIHTGEKPHICDICGDRFSRPDKMRLHRKLHDKNRQYKCKVCGEQFAMNKLLKLHRKTHKSEGRLYECEVCGKNFTLYARLHRHRMIHSGKKPYLCEICGDRFTQSTDLQRHRIIHTGVKAHLCHTCGKKFYHAAHLRRHVKIHDRQKPYICQVCGGQFARSDILKRHEKIHTGEKEFACEQCGKLFTRASHLQRHMLTHTGKAPEYKCTQCPLQFSSQDRLKQHLRTQHSTLQSNDENQQGDCSTTPEAMPESCQRSTSSVLTPDQSRLNSPSGRSQCSEPDVLYGKQFVPSGNPQLHFNHHLGLQPHQIFPHSGNNPRFDCMICGEQFPNAQTLEIHYTVHSNMERYSDKPILEAGQFIPAQRLDFNMRPGQIYRCDTCGERFNDLSHFQIHCLMHTGDFADNFSRQLAQFPPPHFQNPVFQPEKRPSKMENFKPLLGPLHQAQNLALNQPINPSCERSKMPQNVRQTSSPDFPYMNSSQFPEPYRPEMNQPETSGNLPRLPPFTADSGSTKPPEQNLAKKPVSIMNSLKARKRPRLVEAVPNSDQSGQTVGYTLDGQPVLNPDVNVGRNKSEQRKFKCGTCLQLFNTPQERIEHVKIHIADLEKMNSCQFCECKFTNEPELRLHMKHCHNELKDDGLADEVDYSPAASITSSDVVPVSMVPSSNTISVSFQCLDCELSFHSETALRRHGKIHQMPSASATPVKPKEHICDVCFKTFLRPHHLTRHKLIHSGVKPYKCNHCEMAFSRTDKLREHLSKIHGQTYSTPKRVIKCDKCDIIFGTKADLKDHNKTTHPRCLKCDLCPKSFTKTDQLKRHRRTHARQRTSSKNLLNICEYCNHEFRSEYDLNEHVRHIHNDQQTFQCSYCQAKFVSDSDLTLHQSLMHEATVDQDDLAPSGDEVSSRDDDESRDDSSRDVSLETPREEAQEMSRDASQEAPRDVPREEMVTCDVCNASFSNTVLLDKHARREHKFLANEKCTCETCHKEFNSQQQLKRHRKTHSGDKPYMCDECGDSFSRSSHLVRHKIRHTGQREFKCDQCSAEFSRSDHLLCHKRTHTGNKPYVCDICGLQFASTQGLKGHMTSHTGEKPYVCRHCGEKFSRNSHLVRHRSQEHNDGKTHDCLLCGKSFTRRDQLKRHEKTHSSEKPHVCQTCGKAFSRLPLLIRHEKNHEKPQLQQQQHQNQQSHQQQQQQHQQQQPQPSLQHLHHHHPLQHHQPDQVQQQALTPCLGQVGMGRLPITMMEWSKWSEYHHATGPPQFPFSGSILQAAINASHL